MEKLKGVSKWLLAAVMRCFGRCIWTHLSEEGDCYESSCGVSFIFNEGTAEENGCVYCYKCGKKIRTVEYDYGFDDED